MSIRDDVKANMKTEEQILQEKAEEEAERKKIESVRKQHIQTDAIENFKNAIIEESKKGVKGNIINGKYLLPDYGIVPKSRNYYVKGYRMGLFKKYTLWQFTLDDSSTTLICLDAINQYASKENISIDVTLKNDYRQLKVDITKLPEISATCKGYVDSSLDNEIYLNQYRFVVYYSFSV